MSANRPDPVHSPHELGARARLEGPPARRITRPVSALTVGVARVAVGDLSQALPVRSNDEVGRLTRAFNDMLEGLRQRDFIRDTFGRYVSPEV